MSSNAKDKNTRDDEKGKTVPSMQPTIEKGSSRSSIKEDLNETVDAARIEAGIREMSKDE